MYIHTILYVCMYICVHMYNTIIVLYMYMYADGVCTYIHVYVYINQVQYTTLTVHTTQYGVHLYLSPPPSPHSPNFPLLHDSHRIQTGRQFHGGEFHLFHPHYLWCLPLQLLLMLLLLLLLDTLWWSLSRYRILGYL